jgi:hypothetical protein
MTKLPPVSTASARQRPSQVREGVAPSDPAGGNGAVPATRQGWRVSSGRDVAAGAASCSDNQSVTAVTGTTTSSA